MLFSRPLAQLCLATLLAVGSPAAGAEEPGLRIALLCTGSTTDGGWNQLAKEGAEKAAADLGAKVTILQKVAQDRAGAEMLNFAAEGYHLVIAHGYEYLEPATEVAVEAPTMRLAVSGADVARPNIVTIDFDVSHASYQAGVLSARISKTGKLGYIGGAPFPSVKACYRGYLAGARSVRPDISVAETYTSWDQPQQNKAQTEALLAQGIDVVYHNVDAASLGVFEAIRAANTAKGPGSAWVVGCVADQNANTICPDAILGSAIIRLDATFAQLITSVRDGSFAPGVVREDIGRGTCVFVPNPRLMGSLITAELEAELAKAGTDLVAGAITIPAE